MKKHLIFYVYISNDFDTNLAVKLNKLCLKKYINVFDIIDFVLAVDDIKNINDINRGIEWINDVSEGKECKIRVTKNSPTDREGKLILEEIYPLIKQGKKEYVFFAHTKGTKNVVEGGYNKIKSCLRWIHTMYWYNFEYLDEMEKCLESKYGMYGTNLSNYDIRRDSNIQSHNNIYIGTFYWLNPSVINKNVEEGWLKVPEGSLRYFAENLPLFLDRNLITSHNGVILNGMDYNLYEMGDDMWEKYLNELTNGEECLTEENKILESVLGNKLR